MQGEILASWYRSLCWYGWFISVCLQDVTIKAAMIIFESYDYLLCMNFVFMSSKKIMDSVDVCSLSLFTLLTAKQVIVLSYSVIFLLKIKAWHDRINSQLHKYGLLLNMFVLHAFPVCLPWRVNMLTVTHWLTQASLVLWLTSNRNPADFYKYSSDDTCQVKSLACTCFLSISVYTWYKNFKNILFFKFSIASVVHTWWVNEMPV